MLDIILDAVLDSIKLLPFLFITFLLLELIEHKISYKTKDKLIKTKKVGPLFGGLIGLLPQCGFSSMAAEFYIARIISLGTLISIFLSTSDEMLPLFISYNVGIKLIAKTLFIKFLIGIILGFIIDFVYRKTYNEKIKDICEHDKCKCEKSIVKSSLKHTFQVFIFILIINSLLSFALDKFYEKLSLVFLKDTVFQIFITSLIGLIPNCSSSILLTELYLKDIINYGSLISGLLINSGIGILILFKYNKNIKENLNIVLLLYIISVIAGLFINILGV